ncbi:hypothetical protein LU699_06695 [Luteimonas fraxinea]|uniref:Uncharacterized protein n=1 Tax=Luteimonas fraxinea TaxID=2901869 RepID=A0ABS8U6K3_9GAMM|nr:hypothetical protein [Luteimonas fraxinea]MCD9095398.1 hypothetical protein [Luteimonas fraxinea]MCD9126362.1 hypothetical protein [Luteimonas fraxinea]UHH11393.1 hypothetical protein LU699_06695 [Luteimonas fraxinea]
MLLKQRCEVMRAPRDQWYRVAAWKKIEMYDWFPIVFIVFKVVVLGTGMFFAIKWHHDQAKKDAQEKKDAQGKRDALEKKTQYDGSGP